MVKQLSIFFLCCLMGCESDHSRSDRSASSASSQSGNVVTTTSPQPQQPVAAPVVPGIPGEYPPTAQQSQEQFQPTEGDSGGLFTDMSESLLSDLESLPSPNASGSPNSLGAEHVANNLLGKWSVSLNAGQVTILGKVMKMSFTDKELTFKNGTVQGDFGDAGVLLGTSANYKFQDPILTIDNKTNTGSQAEVSLGMKLQWSDKDNATGTYESCTATARPKPGSDPITQAANAALQQEVAKAKICDTVKTSFKFSAKYLGTP